MTAPFVTLLLILDGFGVAPKSDGNAITQARMPVFERLIQTYPTVTLRASGDEVGLSWGEVGNSEVGHLAIGAGRVYYQTLPRIQQAIQAGTFATNPAFLGVMRSVKQRNGRLHLLSLLGTGNVHASQPHLEALLRLAKTEKLASDVVVHGFLDGRDTLYNAGIDFVQSLEQFFETEGVGRFGSLSGRYYAMDRDHRFDRTEKAYRAIIKHEGELFERASDAVKASYAKEVFDEEFVPVVIGDEAPFAPEKDGIILVNFRPDRVRQLMWAMTGSKDVGFSTFSVSPNSIATMTEVEAALPVQVAFPPIQVTHSLAEELSLAGLKQLHIAETEKYAHVTFFLNGTREEPFLGEDRILIPSPKVASYDLAPEMSAEKVADAALSAIEQQTHDVIIVNIANPDMVAHTGDLQATIRALETTDHVIRRLSEAVLERKGLFLLTADHGNAEELKNLRTGEMDKEHATNPVPFVIAHPTLEGQVGFSGEIPEGDLSLVSPVGMLADVAPTLLFLLGLPQPAEMTGQPLWSSPLVP